MLMPRCRHRGRFFYGAKSPRTSWTLDPRAPHLAASSFRARLLDFHDVDPSPARRRRSMEVLHPRAAGLDVHKDTVVACVRVHQAAAAQQNVETFGTSTKALRALREWLQEHGVTHVAMEATGVYWKPVWHVLEGSFELILANAMHIKNVPGRKTDVNDAMWIADLLAHGLIRASFVPPTPIQDLRTLT